MICSKRVEQKEELAKKHELVNKFRRVIVTSYILQVLQVLQFNVGSHFGLCGYFWQLSDSWNAMKRGFLKTKTDGNRCYCKGCEGSNRKNAHEGQCGNKRQTESEYGLFCKRCYRHHLCVRCMREKARTKGLLECAHWAVDAVPVSVVGPPPSVAGGGLLS